MPVVLAGRSTWHTLANSAQRWARRVARTPALRGGTGQDRNRRRSMTLTVVRIARPRSPSQVAVTNGRPASPERVTSGGPSMECCPPDARGPGAVLHPVHPCGRLCLARRRAATASDTGTGFARGVAAFRPAANRLPNRTARRADRAGRVSGARSRGSARRAPRTRRVASRTSSDSRSSETRDWRATLAIDAARGRHLQAGLYPIPDVAVNWDEIGDRSSPDRLGILTAPRVSQTIVTGG
jgi:hypothetical protein